MAITGIVAEFNPFHYGHKYLLEQAEGLKIVAMSGNFVQRGEPAIVDKWTRAQMALENGADIVVELPFQVAVQSADYFAQGAVDILTKMGVDTLAFGTEENLDYSEIARVYEEKSEQMTAFLATLDDFLSYPQKTQLMWEKFTGIDFSGNTPNHILALAYAKASAGKNLRLQPITRQGAAYHSQDKNQLMASATAIRKHISDPVFLKQATPSTELILSAPHLTWDNYYPLLRYQLLTHPDLTQIPQVNQELASRISSAIASAANLEDLVEQVATKRYTKARVRRLLTYILVNAQEAPLPQGIHLLGFTENGQAHLKSLKKSVHLISKIGADPWDKPTQQADLVYRIGHPDLPEQTFGRSPIRILKN
ncbi:nucleotidyltransferase [Streptococcus parauberis]|uniref:tRNA(Met) cytidine acetate ligase n=1 Tax=Streptococcus parauberis TaxID=1348 RepID=A0AAE4HUI9_9STRE|nr:nucleotidyltransferase [Streptococcus parauberis]MDT2730644.1 nucleotidyltransferase [Streptococcus parauberis]